MNHYDEFVSALQADKSLMGSVTVERVSSPFSLADAILKKAAELLKLDPSQLESIIAAAKQAYDKYVAPIDLPGIPNLIEPAIDIAIWRVIESLIRLAATKLS